MKDWKPKNSWIKALSIMTLAGAGASTGQSPGEIAWPEPFVAVDAQISSVGDHININGIPARIYRFTTSQQLDEVVRQFQDKLGRDVTRAPASSALPGQMAVAGRVGDFWITLQLQQRAGETVGTWSAIPQFMPDIKQTVERPPGYPASAKLIQQVDSYDEGKRSQMAVGLDPGPVDGVAQRLDEQLHEQGFVRQETPQNAWSTPSTYVAIYKKGREEVLATLNQERGGTSVMLNRISALEELK